MRQKILFVAQNMNVGGIQTSLLNLLKTIENKCPEKYEVSLFSFGKGVLLENIPDNVSVILGNKALRLSADSFYAVLKRKNPIDILLRILLMIYVRIFGSERFYRKQFKKCKLKQEYDIAISYFNDVMGTYFNQGTNMFVSEYIKAREKLAWIHTDPIKADFSAQYCRKIYKDFDRIICVSGAVKENFEKLIPEYSSKNEVIHNLVPEEEIRTLAQAEKPYDERIYNIVTVGRVDNATKRMDEIIKLCSRLREEGITDFCWHIVGAGPDLSGNLRLVEELGVSNLICFEGEKTNPFPYIKNADLFALFSAYEGFPMVICEAQALGTYILTTSYAAAREQITEDQGFIAASDEEFYQELKRLIKCRN